jgi:hypothetical protein
MTAADETPEIDADQATAAPRAARRARIAGEPVPCKGCQDRAEAEDRISGQLENVQSQIASLGKLVVAAIVGLAVIYILAGREEDKKPGG